MPHDQPLVRMGRTVAPTEQLPRRSTRAPQKRGVCSASTPRLQERTPRWRKVAKGAAPPNGLEVTVYIPGGGGHQPAGHSVVMMRGGGGVKVASAFVTTSSVGSWIPLVSRTDGSRGSKYPGTKRPNSFPLSA